MTIPLLRLFFRSSFNHLKHLRRAIVKLQVFSLPEALDQGLDVKIKGLLYCQHTVSGWRQFRRTVGKRSSAALVMYSELSHSRTRLWDQVPLLSDAELLMSPVMKDDSDCFLTVSFHIRRMRLCREERKERVRILTFEQSSCGLKGGEESRSNDSWNVNITGGMSSPLPSAQHEEIS